MNQLLRREVQCQSEAVEDTHYSTDIVVNPGPRGFWEVNVSVLALRAKVKTPRGLEPVFLPRHRSVLPLLAVLHLLFMVALPSALALVQHFDGLHQVALEGGERGADGRSAKAVGEQAEVSEAALNAGLQAGGGSAAAQRGPVLGHQVHEFLADLPGTKRHEALGTW